MSSAVGYRCPAVISVAWGTLEEETVIIRFWSGNGCTKQTVNIGALTGELKRSESYVSMQIDDTSWHLDLEQIDDVRENPDEIIFGVGKDVVGIPLLSEDWRRYIVALHRYCRLTPLDREVRELAGLVFLLVALLSFSWTVNSIVSASLRGSGGELAAFPILLLGIGMTGVLLLHRTLEKPRFPS